MRVTWRRSLRWPVTAVVAVSLAVPATVILPTVAPARTAPHPVAPQLNTLALSGVDSAALAGEPVPSFVGRDLAGAGATAGAVASRRPTDNRPRVLTARVATSSFETFAVTWQPVTGPDARPDLLVSARYRSTTTGWSRWVELGGPSGDTADGPEARGAARAGTIPYFTGPADGVQVRVDTPTPTDQLPGDLRVDLIDPGTSPADASVVADPPVSSAAASATDPGIITRAQWGADESLRDRVLTMSSTYKVAFVHHTAGTNDYTAAQGPAQVRGLYAYYVNSLGYADMGYNFLVDRFGHIYEGRYGSIDDTPRQAATGGFNTDTMAVAALGNFSSRAAPQVMVTAIGRVIGFRLAKLHADPYGHRTLTAEDGGYKYPTGKRVSFSVISGHRDASATACPGDNLYLRLPAIRQAAKAWIGANLVQPRIVRPVSEVGQQPRVTVRSGVLRKQTWRLQVSDACSGKVVRTVRGSASPSDPIRVTWQGRDDAGKDVPAGRYLARLTSEGAKSRSVPWSGGATVGATPTVLAARAGLPTRPVGRFVPMAPRRLAATATGQGLGTPQMVGPGGRLEVPVLGHAGVPATGVTAVVVSVSTSCATRTTHLSARPARVTGQSAAVVVARPGASRRGTSVVPVGRNGSIVIANEAGWLDVAVDVMGYWTTGGGLGLRPLEPRRVAPVVTDTSGTTVPVVGQGGAPDAATAVILNVRSAPGNAASRVWVWPVGSPRPAVPSVGLSPGTRSSGRVVVAVGAAGAVRVAGDQPNTRLQVDVDAALSTSYPATLHPVAPRLLTASGQRLAANKSLRLVVAGRAQVPKAGVKAVVLQLDAERASRPMVLRAWPNGASQPAVPDVSVGANQPAQTFVVVPVGKRGAVRLATSAGRLAVAASVVGWVG